MRSATAHRLATGRSALAVVSVGHCLKMCRIDAELVLTQMVNVIFWRDRSMNVQVRELVSGSQYASSRLWIPQNYLAVPMLTVTRMETG